MKLSSVTLGRAAAVSTIGSPRSRKPVLFNVGRSTFEAYLPRAAPCGGVPWAGGRFTAGWISRLLVLLPKETSDLHVG